MLPLYKVERNHNTQRIGKSNPWEGFASVVGKIHPTLNADLDQSNKVEEQVSKNIPLFQSNLTE